MPDRVVTKMLGGEEDLLFGRGTVSQARNGGTFDITKLSLVKVVTSIAARDLLDTAKFPFVAVVEDEVLSFYEFVSGTGFVLVTLANSDVKQRGSFNLTSSNLTSIITEDVPTKLLGTTAAGPDNVGFSHTSGRLVFTGLAATLCQLNASIYAAAANQDELKFFFAVNGDVKAGTQVTVPASGTAIPRLAVLTAVLELEPNDYVEVYVSNTAFLTDVTALSYNLSVSA